MAMTIDNCLEELNGSRVLVTGATGLLGRALVKTLLSRRHTIHVVALVRNIEKAKRVFSDVRSSELEFWVADVNELAIENLHIDYIIHAASMTASADFVARPAEVFLTTVLGVRNMLEIARVNSVKSFVYLSSMEVYGTPATDVLIDENSGTDINTMAVRSSYPESKRAAESLCAAYGSEYGVPVKTVRLCQTFGEGVEYDDKRVFAEFARCAIEKRNIVLKTKGQTKRSYLYIDDAVSAILFALVFGENGQAYNAANESTYCTIFDMAQLVATEFGGEQVKVVIDEADTAACGYAPILHMNLDCTKLRGLGWEPTVDLTEAYRRTIDYMKKFNS